ncbi:Hint domain-containing protein [Falsirhodobacter sp. 20TX0035]|uniref:Hint domain-containing protein n=1 Tax=Falsirhodobacter sp. 20TX0035 TaxID=3022019 RepID=UPI00232F6FDC|nr:Hint domain-containing protein [Falsirhodobacter sp. 20TX0035]MDB6454035.1 Hint domain-containing protein [Falsirhodobacter sp. 20TX0035]
MGREIFATEPSPGARGRITLADGTRLSVPQSQRIICFTPGAFIHTPAGLRPIETLAAGDLVLTRDHGPQPVRWIGRTDLCGSGDLAPVRIRPAALAGLTADLVVSPHHRMLIEGARATRLHAEAEVLATARHLVDGRRVTVEERETVTYLHLLFDRHEVIWANGAPTESYHPGDHGLGGLCDAAREGLFAALPQLRALPESYGRTARRVLTRSEAATLWHAGRP